MKNKKLVFGMVLSIALTFTIALILVQQPNGNDNTANKRITETDVLEKPTSTISIESNYQTYANADQLDEGADLIVVASPLKDFKDRTHITTHYNDGAVQDFYTLTEIKIDQVIKTSISTPTKNDTIEIVEPIGYSDPTTKQTKITHEDYSELEKDQQYILFLKKNTYGQFSIINMELGKFKIKDSDKKEDYLSTDETSHSKEYKEKFRDDVLKKYKLKQ